MTVQSICEVHPAAIPLASEHARRLGFTRVAPVGEDPDDPPWDRGWTQDILRYLARDPVYRRWHHDELTRRALGQIDRVLPLSVETAGATLLDAVWGDEWQKRAHVRLLFAWTWALPGHKLVFMGSELGAGLEHLLGDLNRIFREEPALRDGTCEWVDCVDHEHSTATLLRRASGSEVLAAFNFTPVPRPNHRLGVRTPGRWLEILATDASIYGGAGHGNLGAVEAAPLPWRGFPFTLTVTLPPLGSVWFRASTHG